MGFAAAEQRLWNSLPAELQPNLSLGQFRRALKMHFFLMTAAAPIVTFFCSVYKCLLTYLHTYLL